MSITAIATIATTALGAGMDILKGIQSKKSAIKAQDKAYKKAGKNALAQAEDFQKTRLILEQETAQVGIEINNLIAMAKSKSSYFIIALLGGSGLFMITILIYSLNKK